MTMVNRSGRQAIRAKVIIDATPYAALVRQLPDVLTDFNAGKKKASFTVIGGDLKKANDTIQVSKSRKMLSIQKITQYISTTQRLI